MSDRCCPCGSRLDRSSSVRSLKLPYLRMVISMRTMQSLTSETKVCNACRMQYKTWKKGNAGFATILNRLETNMDEINAAEDDLVSVF